MEICRATLEIRRATTLGLTFKGALFSKTFDFVDELLSALLEQILSRRTTEHFGERALRFKGQRRAVRDRRNHLKRLTGEGARTVERKRFRLQYERLAYPVDLRYRPERADRRYAAALKTTEKRAFRDRREVRRLVQQSRDLRARVNVVRARFKPERALTDRRQEVGTLKVLARASG